MDGSSTLKMTTRFSFLLLIAILFILTLTSAQNVTSTSIRGKAEGSILKMYYDVSALPMQKPRFGTHHRMTKASCGERIWHFSLSNAQN
jgi:hypothetical protein